jgi:hypothetical protein
LSRIRLVLAVLGLALAAPACASAATPGLNVSGGLGDLPAARALGAPIARVFVTYPAGGPTSPTPAEFGYYDQIVYGYAAAGIKPILVVTGNAAPPSALAYSQFVGALAARYGSNVAAYEIWNEEDSKLWWGADGGDPALYAALLRASYAQVGGRAPVLLGGMTGNDYAFLDNVYTALGGNSVNAFDAVAVHTDTACSIVGPDSFYRNPDGRISQWSFLGFREVRASMVAHGDSGKSIWMTELGWNTATGLCDLGVSAGKKNAGVSKADQAAFLTQAYHCLSQYDYVAKALWFNVADSGPEASLNRYGLIAADGSHKPSYSAMADVLGGKDADAGAPCGDFDPPNLTVSAPADGGSFLDVLPIKATASDPSGVGRITLTADGTLIRNFTTGKTRSTDFPKTLTGTITWQGSKKLALGPHTLTVTALDGNGNSVSKTLRLTKVTTASLKNIATAFRPLKLTGKGTTRSLRVAITAPTTGAVGFRAVHKVHVLFQKRVGGKWRTAHKYTKTAKQPFTLKVTLARGPWRVRAVFPAKAPFRASATPYLRFTV